MNPEWKLNVSANGIQLYNIPLKTVTLKAKLAQNRADATTTFFSQGISGNGTLNAIVDSALTSFDLKNYTASVTVDTFSTNLLSRVNQSLSTIPPGIISLQSHVQGSSAIWPDTVLGTVTFSGENFTYPVKAKGGLALQDWNASVVWGKNTLSGKGKLEEQGTISGKVITRLVQPYLISSFFTDQVIRGSLNASTTINGKYNKLNTVSYVKSNNLKWKSMQVTDLSGIIFYNYYNYKSSGVSFKDLHITAKGKTGSVLRYFSIDSTGGNLWLTLNGSGTLSKPRVNVQLQGSGIFYKQFIADTLFGNLHLSGLDTITWNNLTVEKNLLRMTSRGIHYTGSSPQTDVDVQLLLRKGKSWSRSGEVQIKGEFSGNSLQGMLNIDNVDMQVINPWVSKIGNYGGVLSAQADVSGTFKNPGGSVKFTVQNPVYRNYEFRSIAGNLSLKDSLLQTKLYLLLSDSVSTVDVSGKIPLEPARGWGLDTSGSRTALIHIDSDTFGLTAINSIFPQLINANGSAVIHLSLTNSNGPWNLDGTALTNNSSITYEPLGITAQGVNADSKLTGTLQLPQIDFTALTGNILLQSQKIESSYWSGVFHGDTINLDSGYAKFQNGGTLRVKGSVPLASIDSLLSSVDPDLQFQLTKVPLSVLQPFIPGLNVKGGTLEGSGDMVLKNGRLYSNG